jgi:aminoglycoside 6'-N-acetyltransferase I
MKLVPIERSEFSLWSKFRTIVYPILDSDYDLNEIEKIFRSEFWHCWFIEREDGERTGLVELSLRNIVDGCLSSPVPYIEGLYIIESDRNKGIGEQVIEIIKNWSRERGYTELATDAELSNSRAQRFYERLGFETVDQVVEYRLELGKT